VTVHRLVACDLVVGQSQAKRTTRKRGPNLRALIEQAKKAGRAVSSVTLPDGTCIAFGDPAIPDHELTPQQLRKLL
jgi:hypothetical protein